MMRKQTLNLKPKLPWWRRLKQQIKLQSKMQVGKLDQPKVEPPAKKLRLKNLMQIRRKSKQSRQRRQNTPKKRRLHSSKDTLRSKQSYLQNRKRN